MEREGLRRGAIAFPVAAIVALTMLSACGSPARIPGPPATVPPRSGAASAAPSDDGVSVARNVGTTLVVLSLDPGAPGDNAVGVDLRDASGAAVAGSARVDLSLDGSPVATAPLGPTDRRGTLAVPRAGHAVLTVSVTGGPVAGLSVAFDLDLPVARVSDGTLAAADAAIAKLHTMRETETLTGGGPVLLFHFEYEAPDRVRYTMIGPTGTPQETRLIGRDRFDRSGDGPWTRTDLGYPTKVPYSAYAPHSTRVRLIGREAGDGQEVLEIAFVQGSETYYTIWVGAHDHLVRRYVMMTKGHYMTGVYSDYDMPLAVAAP